MSAQTRLEIEINGRQIEAAIELEASSASTLVSFTTGDQSVSVEVSQPEPGRYHLRLGNTVFRCDRDRLADGTESIVVNGRRIAATARDPRRRRREHPDDHGAVRLTSPMPGRVVACLVEPGANVERGAGIIIVEAMKMQNEINAPRAGRVTEIRATPGQTVDAGEVLATLE